MAALLGWFWTEIAPYLLPFVWEKMDGALKAYIERKQREKQIKDQAQSVTEQTEAAQSPKEREEAQDADRHTF